MAQEEGTYIVDADAAAAAATVYGSNQNWLDFESSAVAGGSEGPLADYKSGRVTNSFAAGGAATLKAVLGNIKNPTDAILSNAAKIQVEDLKHRFQRVSQVDADCYEASRKDFIGKENMGDHRRWPEVVLLEHEEVLGQLQCVGMQGAASGKADEMLLGAGLLVLSKLRDGEHRLHVMMKDHGADFEASESWEASQTLGVETAANLSWEYRSQHAQYFHYETFKVEDSIISSEYSMVDTATLLASTSSVRAMVKCCECCDLQCSCKCLGISGFACFSKTKGAWHQSASLHQQLEEILDQIEEKQVQINTKMPDVKAGQYTEYRTMINRKVRCLSLTYIERATLQVRKFSAVLHPSESVKGASKVCSMISRIGKAQANMPDTVKGGAMSAMSAMGAMSAMSTKRRRWIKYPKLTAFLVFGLIVFLAVLIYELSKNNDSDDSNDDNNDDSYGRRRYR